MISRKNKYLLLKIKNKSNYIHIESKRSINLLLEIFLYNKSIGELKIKIYLLKKEFYMESSLKSKIKKYKKVALYANKLKTRTVFLRNHHFTSLVIVSPLYQSTYA